MTTDATTWNESDLLQLIANAVRENVQLDYKSCGALQNTDGKKAEISKDVSALANSAGGVLIYGIIEEGHIPSRIDEGFDPAQVTKEWLEQVINLRIQRRIEGVVINPVNLLSTHPGRVAYVVVVPQSTRAPHQASDKRFYKRFNFESVPMEEYEVRDVSRRAEVPQLSIIFGVEDMEVATVESGQAANEFRRINIMAFIQNESPVPAEYVAINIYIDSSVSDISNIGDFKRQNDSPLSVSGRLVPCYRLHANHSIPAKIPIFSGSLFRLLDSPMTLDVTCDGDYLVGYSLHAPYMAEVFGAVLLRVTGQGAVIADI
jgi:hypothetical protein